MSNLKLVKPNNTTPVLKNESLKQEIVESISTGLCTIPEDIVKLFNIPYEQVILLLNDPQFISLVGNYTRAKLNLDFHTNGTNKLRDMVKSDDPKIALQAIKLEAQITNNLKQVGTDVNINLNLESLVKESEKNIHPLDKFIDLEKVG